jgi:hypothetical protein
MKDVYRGRRRRQPWRMKDDGWEVAWLGRAVTMPVELDGELDSTSF